MRWWERDPWLELAQVLLRNPFRTLLSSLGVGWGLFMILITVGASNGLEEGVKADMGNRVKNSAFLWGESTSLPYKGYARGRGIELTTMDVAFLGRKRDHVGGRGAEEPARRLAGRQQRHPRAEDRRMRGLRRHACVQGHRPDCHHGGALHQRT